MSRMQFTPAQQQAINTVDRSVLVSAAAGSGKTAVLAERCAYLVCEAPPPYRCDVEQLLVLTFTDAAAAEMRSRIAQAILDRAGRSPRDSRLQIQARAVGAAQISTIHSFCLSLARRGFDQLGIDPGVGVLDEHEAELMRGQALEDLFEARYASAGPARQSFENLIEHYGLGDDGRIKSFVLNLDGFLRSLPEPDLWIRDANAACGIAAEATLRQYVGLLAAELDRQQEFCRTLATRMPRPGPLAAYYVNRIVAYAAEVESWARKLSGGSLEAFDAVRESIAAWDGHTRDAPRKRKEDSEQVVAERDRAKALFDQVRERAYAKRLKRRYGWFSLAELKDGLTAVAPFVRTFLELVTQLQDIYQARKRAGAVLDYADLERCGYQLLRTVSEAPAIRAEMQRRFMQVLVDEFQDINPLQAAIIEAVSREGDAGRAGNLFVVGDVKQSIYRFRLAEPGLFLQREQMLASGRGERGAVVRLESNFRSRAPIIDGVNRLFELLMRPDAAGIDYAQGHRLTVGRADDGAAARPIDVHLLAKVSRGVDFALADEEEDEAGGGGKRFVDMQNPVEWEAIEREAYLIGSEIQKITTESGGRIEFGDIAILLRAAAHTVGPIADVLHRMGIPTQSDAGQGLLHTREIRDVVAALKVIDNPLQDIELAAVMRSGVFGHRFSEAEMLAIRDSRRRGNYHQAVLHYGAHGPLLPLKERLADFLTNLDRLRRDFRRRPVAEAMGHFLEESGYEAFVSGLSHGAQRRSNLRKLRVYAGKFEGFSRQGLHRFLRFLEGMERHDRDWSTAGMSASAGQAVRIMSIHRSKGLEFPVVFLADLGRRFNLSDVRGSMIFDRQAGIGLHVMDRDRMIEYPSALHHLVAERTLDQNLAEELRVLYVGLTRARDRLILVGTIDGEVAAEKRTQWRGQGALDPLTLMSAANPLDWLVPALTCMGTEQVRWPDGTDRARPVFAVRFHDADEMADWNLSQAGGDGVTEIAQTAARLAPLPVQEPCDVSSPEVEATVSRLEFVYPRLAVTSIRAVMGASEAKRQLEAVGEFQERAGRLMTGADPVISSTSAGPASSFSFQGFLDRDQAAATALGSATHALLQHLDLGQPLTESAIRDQLETLVQRGVIASSAGAGVDLASILWFFQTPLGQRIRRRSGCYHREYPFVMALPADGFDAQLVGGGDEEVLVRGIVDGLLVSDDRVELVDFKTDRVAADEAAARAETYRFQLEWYAQAVERIWRRPVPADGRHLVFLHPRVIVELG